MPDHSLLEMKGIEIEFPGVKALDKVDFSVNAGEIHALLGENGAGKSTLIKCLTGVHHMDAGTILFDGKEIRPNSPQEAFSMGISTVYQEINLCPNLTVAENIFVGRQPMKGGMINWKEINRRAKELMSRFHMDIDVTRPLNNYSTAIQQMVSIARAVDIDAKILILDEPTSSLDDNEVQLLFNVMRELKAEGMGIIFITHFLDQIFAVSDRMTILRNGTLVGTYNTTDITKLQLVTLMIGKDIDVIFNLKRAHVDPNAPEMLRTENLGTPGQIQNVNLSMKKGELLGFAGLLGSGRTETAELIFGAVPATEGTEDINGKRVSIKKPLDAIKAKLAFCPEDRKRDGIIGDLSIRENIALALQARRGFLHPISRQEQNELADKYIKLLSIATPDAEKKIGDLSGGNQQKVILARWMATQPDLLILDEPTRGIDVGAKAEIQRLMLEMCNDGVSVIFISSELEEIIRCSNRIIVMRDGKKVGEVKGEECTQQTLLSIIAEGVQEGASA
ncbi:MAG: sugar ABC transporter ATP-binding protein [Oscillospiraceae bacterium]|nr:sugar ABC transporter ATP-binding protein [Oscillospiraceae bacterium]